MAAVAKHVVAETVHAKPGDRHVPSALRHVMARQPHHDQHPAQVTDHDKTGQGPILPSHSDHSDFAHIPLGARSTTAQPWLHAPMAAHPPAPAGAHAALSTASGIPSHPLGTTRQPALHRPAVAVPSSRGLPTATHHLVRSGAVKRSSSSMPLSAQTDPAEREATEVARRVMRMPIPSPATSIGQPASKVSTRPLSLAAAPAPPQRPAAQAQRAVEPDVATEIRDSLGSGQPLPANVLAFMTPRFHADFSAVRIHTTPRAARLAARLQARAFAFGRHVFFGKDQFRPNTEDGRELIAHELTHTIQQREVIQRQPDTTVTVRAPMQVQRLGVDDALHSFAEQANNIPGFRMFTIVLGMNPITLQQVERNAANVLRAVVEFMPGGGLITQALDRYGIFESAGTWVDGQLRSLGMTATAIKTAISQFLDGLHWDDILHLDDVWERAKHILTGPIDHIKSFVSGLVDGVVKFVKDAILKPLGELASKTRGWDLLTAVLGRNPITGEAVARNAETLIGGFMKLIGQEDVWQNIQDGKAIPRCWAWFEKALTEARAFVAQIPTLFLNTLHSLGIQDLVEPVQAFARVANTFGTFAVQFTTWAGNTVWNLLEIVFDVVKPGAFAYVKRTGAALKGILKNPLPFVGNLVNAAKQGFLNFGHNIGTHLKAGLIDWLTGSLPGVYIPKAFELGEIVKFVFSVLGLTWANMRVKLVKAVGETAVKAMETGFDIVVTLVRQGPAAAWDKIKEQLSNLRDMVISGITDLVVDAVLKKAVPRLIAMFIPGAGFISAIVSIYDTVMVFVNKLSQIAAVVTGFIDSIVAIAAGQIGPASARVETALAGVLSLAVNFLAGFAGLGKIADKIMGVIGKIRATIDKALDWLIGWIVAAARKLGRFVAQAGVPQDPNERLRLAMRAAQAVIKVRPIGARLSPGAVAQLTSAIRMRYGLSTLEAISRNNKWWLRGTINPTAEQEIPEAQRDILVLIRQVADEEFAAIGAGPVTGTGKHEDPYIVPVSGGVGAVARQMVQVLPPNIRQTTTFNVTQAGQQELRGTVQTQPLRGPIEGEVYGSTKEQRRIDIGKYPAVAAAMSHLGPNDRWVAGAMREILAGGDVPASMTAQIGWIGGFKLLVAQEIRRDPVALATLSANIHLVERGSLSFVQVFQRAADPSTDVDINTATETTGGFFSHSSQPAVAPLRAVREQLGFQLPENSPQARGKASQQQGVRERDLQTILRYVRSRISADPQQSPPTEEVRRLVREAIRTLTGVKG